MPPPTAYPGWVSVAVFRLFAAETLKLAEDPSSWTPTAGQTEHLTVALETGYENILDWAAEEGYDVEGGALEAWRGRENMHKWAALCALMVLVFLGDDPQETGHDDDVCEMWEKFKNSNPTLRDDAGARIPQAETSEAFKRKQATHTIRSGLLGKRNTNVFQHSPGSTQRDWASSWLGRRSDNTRHGG